MKCYDHSFTECKIEGKSPVRRLLVKLVQRRKDEATPEAVAPGVRGVYM